MNPHAANHAFKSRYYVEKENADADVKVDWDDNRNPIKERLLRETRRWLDGRKIRIERLMILETAKGWHLRAWTSKRLGAYTTLRVQTMLGDDPVRQRFNARRVKRKERSWNVLWNEKWRNGQLIYREELNEEWTQRANTLLIA